MTSRGAVWLTRALTAAAAVLSSPAYAAQLGGGHAPDVPFLRIALALIVGVCLALIAALWLKRRRMPATASPGRLHLNWLRPPSRHIEVLETQRISPHADASLLRYAGKRYLVVVSGAAVTLLDTSAEPKHDHENEP